MNYNPKLDEIWLAGRTCRFTKGWVYIGLEWQSLLESSQDWIEVVW